jgi:hypothetical protein
MPFLTSRSAIKEYHRCPRARYYQYHFDGTGIVPVSQSVPLVVGSVVHVGLEALIKGEGVETAVGMTLDEYARVLDGRGFEPDSEVSDGHYTYLEQQALVEALIRCFYYRGLQPFLEEYKVLETEREIPFDLFPGGILETRADGRLESTGLGGIYALSWKTTNSYDKRKERDNETDDQGLSEWAAMNAWLEKEWRASLKETPLGLDGLHKTMLVEDPPRVSGVQMVYLKKGTRTEWPANSGRYYQNSSLVRPWMRDDFPSPSFAHSYEWTDETGNHRLGKGWRRVNIWEHMPIREWLMLLDSGRVQPEAGDFLAGCVIMPPPYVRREDEIQDWVEQAAAQESRIHKNLVILGQENEWVSEDSKNLRRYLNVMFPQHRRSCNYPTACSYKKICFGPCGDDPLGSGYYTRRQAHHALEKEKHNAGEGGGDSH